MKIEIVDNELSPIVYERNINYSDGPGYGSIDLIVVGQTALERSKEKLELDSLAEPNFAG